MKARGGEQTTRCRRCGAVVEKVSPATEEAETNFFDSRATKTII